ncbi:MAG: sialate O-acetylesterase [Bacillota bacterium]
MKKRFALNPIFTDNMMFQANKPIKIYGICKKNTEITIKFLEQEKTIKTVSNKFVVELKPEDYNDKPFAFSVSSKKHTVKIYNVLIGDVFLFLGGKRLKNTLNDISAIEDYKDKNIRVLDLTNNKKWLTSSRDDLTNISAISYRFLKNAYKKLKKPIGVITYSNESENIFTWSNKTSVLIDKEMYNFINCKIDKKNNILGKDFEFLKANIFNLAFKAINFYQGENDLLHYHFYEKAFRLLIKVYRLEFKDKNLPFNIIQLPSLSSSKNYIAISEIRIAQSNLFSDKNKVNLISAIDINKINVINETNNYLAKRLTDLVFEKQYKKNKNTLNPQVFSYKVSENSLYIYIANNYLNLISRSGQNLSFTYTENKIDYLPLKKVKLNGNQITIKINPDIKEIRYAYENNPKCDIFSSNGLPLLPFRISLS